MKKRHERAIVKVNDIGRWVIKENITDRYWTGEEWSNHFNEALIYANVQKASLDLMNLNRLDRMDQAKLFRATIDVEVLGGKSVNVQELKDYLEKAAELYLNGAMESENIVQAMINWDDLSEV
jgi:Xaa-Pro aminopeptidase